MPESEKQLPDEESKSQRKREMLALQELGKILTTFTDTQLNKIPISEDLKAILRVMRTLKTHESKRRHMQYIGKKMRAVDAEAVKKAIENIQMGNAVKVNQFHEVEVWRDRLITEGDDALQVFFQAHPDADRQHLRQLIRKAQHDVRTGKNSGGSLELFRCLREILA